MQPTDRRAVIRTLVGGAIGLALPGCRSVLRLPPDADGEYPVSLPPVWVRPERIIRTVVGHRPYRPSGYVVRVERMGDKTIVHNYGHGGGGVSLSWGSAWQAAQLAKPTGARRFAVLGAGVMGLSTARLLQEDGHEVTIYTKDLPLDTTSAVAGAQWSPTTVADRSRVTPAFAAQFSEAAHYAYRRFQRLAGERYGIRWMPNYFLSQRPPSTGGASDTSVLATPLRMGPTRAPGENPFPGMYAQRMFTMMIEPSRYLPALLEDFHRDGGRLVLREFADASALQSLDEPVLINCTGLGARRLVNDPELMPIKGQLVFVVPQAEVQYATLGNDLYMFPRRDGILLGGTFERGVESSDPDPAQTERILSGHRQLFDAMAHVAKG